MPIRLFIVGAVKAGTTSLHNYLSQHPDIYMSPVKEPHFFSQVRPDPKWAHITTSISDPDAYEELFRGATTEKVIGEASPSYLWEPNTPARIRAYAPDAKIIIMLRAPIDRAYSHYLMDVRGGRQQLPFDEAVKEDYTRESKGWGVSHLYVELGLYHEQVRRYLQHFGEEQVLIVFYEEFSGNTRATLRQVFEFLDVDTDVLQHIDYQTRHNPYAAPRNLFARAILSATAVRRIVHHLLPQPVRLFLRDRLFWHQSHKPRIDPEAVRFMRPIFYPDAVRLESLIGRPLPSSWYYHAGD